MLEIAENDILQSLERDNPWWAVRGGATPTAFAHTRAYFAQFRELARNWDIRRLLLLMGPRRCGKLFVIHQLVEHALKGGFPPGSTLFASIDNPLFIPQPPYKKIDLL